MDKFVGDVDAEAADDADGDDPANASYQAECTGSQFQHAPDQQGCEAGNPAQCDGLVETLADHSWHVGFFIRVQGILAEQHVQHRNDPEDDDGDAPGKQVYQISGVAGGQQQRGQHQRHHGDQVAVLLEGQQYSPAGGLAIYR